MVKNQAKIKYTEEFKQQVIEVYKSGIYATAKECANNYGVSPKTFSRWLIESCKPVSNESNELKNMQKEIAKLKMENEILKKAAAYFALHVK
ncbi:MAG: transposase [Burkholderiales bacterium]